MYETRDRLETDRLETPVRAFMRPGVSSVADDASPHQLRRTQLSHHVHAPNDTAGDAADLLRNPGATHLLVARRGDCAPEAVGSDLDVVRVLES